MEYVKFKIFPFACRVRAMIQQLMLTFLVLYLLIRLLDGTCLAIHI